MGFICNYNIWTEFGTLDANSESNLTSQDDCLYALSKYTVGTDNNAALIKRIDIGSNLSVSEQNIADVFQFYPNPANDVIQFNQTVDKVTISSLQGKILKEAKEITELRIDQLSTGMYFLNFELTNSVKLTKKLIKN